MGAETAALTPSSAQRDDAAHPPVAALSEKEQIADQLEVVTQGFHWLNVAAGSALDRLKGELDKTDEPPFVVEAAEAVMEVAIGSGAAAVGEYLAGKVVGEHAEIAKEALKAVFEEGIPMAVSLGNAGILTRAARPNLSASEFMDTQKHAVMGGYVESQKTWITTGRHAPHTLASAGAQAQACSQANLEAAAAQHHASARNAWLSYLAQSRFGTTEADGREVTNMTDQKHRDWVNSSAPGLVPAQAPTMKNAITGGLPGVLAVDVKLPNIFMDSWSGTPEVVRASLSGVNDAIREQYEGQPLAASPVPRLIRAEVADGEMFELRIDESGRPGGHVDSVAGAWMLARPIVGHLEKLERSADQRANEGLALLLNDLVPERILG